MNHSGFFSKFSIISLTWWFLFLSLHFLPLLPIVPVPLIILMFSHCVCFICTHAMGPQSLEEVFSKKPDRQFMIDIVECSIEVNFLMASICWIIIMYFTSILKFWSLRWLFTKIFGTETTVYSYICFYSQPSWKPLYESQQGTQFIF